jgi:hypothetical protein
VAAQLVASQVAFSSTVSYIAVRRNGKWRKEEVKGGVENGRKRR